MNEPPIRVLLVEDNPGDARLIRELLADAGGGRFSLEQSDCLSTTFDRLEKGGIDIVLADLGLPDSQGFETFLALRERAPAVPLVMLTGLDDESLAARAVAQGAQDYLVKGKVDGEVLVRSVRYAIERKRAEDALRLSENRFRTAFDHAGIGRGITSVEGRFIRVNQSLCSITGYCEQELLGKTWRDLTHPDNLEAHQQFVDRLLDGEAVSHRMELRALHKDGHWVWIDLTVVLVRDSQGTPLHFIGDIQDITERKRAVEELQKHRVRLEELVTERTAELETANKELEAFAYSVSHDLRGPLRAIEGFSAILQQDYGAKLDAEGERLLNVVRENTGLMGRLIEDLLELSRVGRSALDPSRIDMNKLAANALRHIEQQNGDYHLNVTMPDHLPPAIGDKRLIQLVWDNLLSNAAKFTAMRDGANIEVSGSVRDGENIFAVRDNGVGFDMKYSGKLFSLFQRLHGRDEFEGTGVGLTIARSIVERHGGRVWAEGKMDQGATFYFALPSG